ncbi:hypothetical protein [Halocatena salina]|uniref:Uncharacterized protein n=1 Tax=Halocatena salina TaxID=2934340 RepID=A0A8U0A3R0_9EURY|nr:hypothetical protein [Halocatena salina]UPM43722.1 hypothetical protein MW046_04555 [Halocatena salina]
MSETLRDIEFNRDFSEEEVKEWVNTSPEWKPDERVEASSIEYDLVTFVVYQQDSSVGWFDLNVDEIPHDVESGQVYNAEIEGDTVVWMQFDPEVTERSKERLEENYDDVVTTVEEDYENVDRGE